MPLVDTPDCLARFALLISTSKMSISTTFIFLQTVWTSTACAQVFDFRSSLSIRDFFGPFLFCAPFFASRTLRTHLVSAGWTDPQSFPSGALLRLTRFALRGMPSITLSVITARSSSVMKARQTVYLSRTTSPLSFWVSLSFS